MSDWTDWAMPPDLSTKEGMAEFAARDPARRPPLLTVADYAALSTTKRQKYDAARVNYLNNFGPLATTDLQRIHGYLDDLLWRASRNTPGARAGIAIDGLGMLGKTTILMQYARLHWRRGYDLHPEGITPAGEPFVPVAYVTLTGDSTTKALSLQLLDYFGKQYPRGITGPAAQRDTQKIALRSRTSLVIIDDVHFLNLRRQSHRDVNNYLKHLANLIPAVFVYAGIALEDSHLFDEGQRDPSSSQTKRRFRRFPVEEYYNDAGQRWSEWLSLLQAYEQHLPLLHNHEGKLSGVKMSKYLLKRTHGIIGHLDELLILAAATALDTGDEKITRDLLDDIEITATSST